MLLLANKYRRLRKLHVQISVASCQSNFMVHEVMNSVANLKIHLTTYTGIVNMYMSIQFSQGSQTNYSLLKSLSERIAKGYSYEPYPYIMLLSSICNVSNDSNLHIYGLIN